MPLQVLGPHDSRVLSERGLLLRGVLSVAALPEPLRATLAAQDPAFLDYAQLLVFAHAGPRTWRALQTAPADLRTTEDPIDTFSVETVREHLEHELGVQRFTLLYPGHRTIPLQELGALLGWHHPSPLRVGINHTFGTWFAYRVALLADTNLPLSPLPDDAASAPCATCVDKPCLSACLGNALTQGDLSLPHCIDFRTRPESPCAHRCPAREACPIAPEHRYDADQIRYHYGVSLKMLTR